MKQNDTGTTIVAVCGKGGVGKTSVSALLTRVLAENPQNRILAIDADPAVGLATSLSITPKMTVDDVRNDFIDGLKKGKSGDKKEILSLLDYQMFEALQEHDNVAFLAVGRPETDGCYCQVNTFLKQIIKEISENFDYVIIDCEAGIEQVNRRVMEMMTHLLLVSDTSAKGRLVVETIHSVAKKTVQFSHVGLLVNRARDEKDADYVKTATSLPVVGVMQEDELLYRYDREEKSFLNLPECPALSTARSLAKSFLGGDPKQLPCTESRSHNI